MLHLKPSYFLKVCWEVGNRHTLSQIFRCVLPTTPPEGSTNQRVIFTFFEKAAHCFPSDHWAFNNNDNTRLASRSVNGTSLDTDSYEMITKCHKGHRRRKREDSCFFVNAHKSQSHTQQKSQRDCQGQGEREGWRD